MYYEFYKLKESPFSLVADPRFLFYSESHCEAMAHILYGVRERKGLILLAGEAGTGKTTLVRATLEMLRSTRVIASVIFNPMLSRPEDVLDAILRGYGLRGYQLQTLDMSEVLERFLQQQVNRGFIPVIIVDEAQELQRSILEQLRLLSNLEYRGQKLVQIVFSAQPEMAERLDTYEMRALRQRITLRCRLSSLSARDVVSYIVTRAALAGAGDDALFTSGAMSAIYRYSGGIPRLINMIADNCLLAGYAKGLAVVDEATAVSVATHLELNPVQDDSGRGDDISGDLMRGSGSWKEIVHDLRHADVPPALKQYIQNLRVPERAAGTALAMSAAVQQAGK